MARLFKFVVWLVVGMLVFFALAATALYLFFDPNDFREDIAAAVKNKTGRELTIEGDISLELFPWLAVEVGDVSLGDAPGFSDEAIARFDRATLSVRLLPIIVRQEVIVGAATIEGLQVNLKVNEQGVSNWDDLAATNTNAVAQEGIPAAETSAFNINRIDIRDASIRYNNAETGDRYQADMDLQVGRMRGDGTPIPLNGKLKFSLQPAGIAGDIKIDTTLAYDNEKAITTLSNIVVDGEIEGVANGSTELHFSTAGIVVSSSESMVSIEPADLTLMTMRIQAKVEPFSYEDDITLQASIRIDAFSPREIMTLFDVEAPVTADPNALTRVVVAAAARLTTSAIELTDVNIEVDDTTFSGTLSVPRGTTGAYRFDLSGDQIDLNRYMAPAAEAAGIDSGDAIPLEIPIDLIKPLNGHGKMRLANAKVGEIVLTDVSLALNASNGRLRLFPVSAELFGGSYNGDVQIDASGSIPILSVNEKIQGVDLAKLVKAMYDQDNVTGTIDGSFVLSGKGADLADIQRSLAGNMSFELRDGTYEGTDIWYELRRARAKIRNEEPPQAELPARTSFGKVRATGVVTNGVLRNDDLFAEIPHLQLTGTGTVNLALATMDYRMTARVLERPELLSDATPEELAEFTEAVIPLRISGPLASPSVTPDLERLLRQRVEEEIKDRLEDKLKDLFKR